MPRGQRKRARSCDEQQQEAVPPTAQCSSRCVAAISVLPLHFVLVRASHTMCGAHGPRRTGAFAGISALARRTLQSWHAAAYGIKIAGVTYMASEQDEDVLDVTLAKKVKSADDVHGLWWIGRFPEVTLGCAVTEGLVHVLQRVTTIVGFRRDAASNSDVALLPMLPSLRTLDLHFHHMVEPDHAKLNAGLSALAPTLKELSIVLHFSQWDGAVVAELTHLESLTLCLAAAPAFVMDGPLSRLTSLTYLELMSLKIDESAARTVSKSLTELPQLTSLHFGAPSNPEAMQELATGIALCTRLRELSIIGLRDNTTAVAAVHAVAGLDNLRSFCMTVWSVNLATAHALARSLENLTDLREFVLTESKVDEGCHEILAPAIGNLPRLEKLDFYSGSLRDAGAVAIGAQLHRLSRLTHLSVFDCEIRDAGLAALTESIAQLKALRELDLSGNRFSKEALIAAMPQIAQLSELCALSTWDCNIGPEGMEAISPHLACLSRLQKLDVRNTGLGVQGAKVLARVLPSLWSLYDLCVRECGVQDVGARALVRAAVKCPQLLVIQMQDNDVFDKERLRGMCSRRDNGNRLVLLLTSE